jgi:hypothetical protein
LLKFDGISKDKLIPTSADPQALPTIKIQAALKAIEVLKNSRNTINATSKQTKAPRTVKPAENNSPINFNFVFGRQAYCVKTFVSPFLISAL